MTSETDESGLSTSYSYQNPTGNTGVIETIIYPGGFIKITEYFFDGKVKSVSGSSQVAIYYDYGIDSNNCTWQKVSYGSPNGPQWRVNYTNALGQLVKVEDSGFNNSVVMSNYIYDKLGRVIKKSITGVADTLYAYDEFGRLIREGIDTDNDGVLALNSMNQIIDYEHNYSVESNIVYRTAITKTYPKDGSDEVKVISIETGQLTSLPNLVVTLNRTVDIYGNETINKISVDRSNKTMINEVVYPDSTVSLLTTYVNELKVSERSPSNITTTYEYDGLGRLIAQISPRTGAERISYFVNGIGKTGKVQSVTDSANNSTIIDYDTATGRRISVKNASGKYSRYEYNNYGQVTKVFGEAEYPISFGYDDYGRQSSITTYRDTMVNFGGVTFPNTVGDTTRWVYDQSSGLVTAKLDPANQATNYDYTSDGKLSRRTWARGVTTNYNYDSVGRLTLIDYSDTTSDISKIYNRLGLVTTINDSNGTRNFTYSDNLGLTRESINGIVNQELVYNYSNSGIKGRYLGLVDNSELGYDSYGRLNQVNDISFSRVENSNLLATVTRPNGVNTTWNYEANRNLVSSINSSNFNISYINNAIGNRTSITRANETITYSYNDRSEVIWASSNLENSPYNYSYNFDPIGNRLSANLAGGNFNYTVNALNQYTLVNDSQPTYDLDGNMLNNDGWSYTWNGENRLVKAENATTKLEFDYDYMGRRIYKKVYDGETLTKYHKFVYDDYKLIKELDGLNNDVVTKLYTWQPEVLGLDTPLSLTIDEEVYYYQTDANKNVLALTSSTGEEVASYKYSPFGKVVSSTGLLAEENPFRFSSEYHDDETNLVYYNYRYYSPDLGRWLSRDPIEEQGGYNLYGMCSNDTINLWDNLGHGHAWWCTEKYKDLLNNI